VANTVSSLIPDADTHHDGEERGRSKLALPLQLPKNRSTGNLAISGDTSEKARMRFSFDAGAAAAEYEALTRSVCMDAGAPSA
jgi:protein-serine/threonine kinase